MQAAGRQVRLAAVSAEAFRVALHAVLRGLLAAAEVRLRHAQGAVLEPDPDRPDDARRGAGAAARPRRYDDATVAQEFEYVATKLGITVEELQGYMDAPEQELSRTTSRRIAFYMLGARVMKALGLELGAKR